MPPKKTATLKSLKAGAPIQTQVIRTSSIVATPVTAGPAGVSAAPAGGACGCSNGGTCVGCDGRCKCKTWFGCHFLGTLKQKKAIAGVFASFFILWAVQFVTHGNLLMPLYAQSAGLWLPTAEMSLPGILIGNALLSVIATILFYQAQRFGSYWEGIRLGKLIFTPLIIAVLYQWSTRPLPDMIAIAWAIEYCVEGALIGLTLTAFGKCGCLSGKWFGGCDKSKAKAHHHHGGGCC